MSRQRSRQQKKQQQRGGFIRDNVPQFSEFCGTNPLYQVLPNPETCTSCQKGGSKRRNRRSQQKKQQQRGGFIRDNVPQFSEFCGTNPLYKVLPNPETCTSCQKGGSRKNNQKRSRKQQRQRWF